MCAPMRSHVAGSPPLACLGHQPATTHPQNVVQPDDFSQEIVLELRNSERFKNVLRERLPEHRKIGGVIVIGEMEQGWSRGVPNRVYASFVRTS